jgi:hypothetical protein
VGDRNDDEFWAAAAARCKVAILGGPWTARTRFYQVSRVRVEEYEPQSRPTRVSGVLRWAVVVNLEWSAVIGRAGHVTYSAPGLDIGAVSNESASNLVADGLKRN